jgi:hypothetical protein
MLIENTSLHLVAPATLEEVQKELSSFLGSPSKNLQDFITKIAIDGGTSNLTHPVQALPIFRTSNTSGYNYTYNKQMVAYLRFGITTSGYFVVQTLMLNAQSSWVSHYFHSDGSYAFSEGPISHTFAQNSESIMESNCPIISHLYNILSDEYLAVKEGKETNTKRVRSIETSLQRLNKTRSSELSISKGMNDEAINQLNAKMMEIDLDPVYTWKERHQLIRNLKEERSKLISTKKRAHQKNIFNYTLPLFAHDLKDAGIRFFKRPLNNFFGILERICIDPIRWFFKVVRSNMGYSVALAIYSPFTYFFITQPMNPHATFAVGKVRSAYIATVESIEHALGIEDKKVEIKPTATGIVLNAAATASASSRGMLLTTDVPEVDNQTWDDRMNNFKNMQNSYESNMESAPRMGRLEQMETQLNWPLIVESAWNETERYANFLNFIETNSKDYLPSFVQFVKAEKARTEQAQLYLWDRNIRFILDHPFTLMDQSKDQTQLDYYVGRAFIQLRDMTNTLIGRYKGLAMPKGYEAISQLAAHFESDYKTNGSVLERLKNNSKLFAQKDKTDSQELREYMKRQWEILYLLQSRAQEGAVHALQMQVWSVRNAVWIIQSLYSSKHEEMSSLAFQMKPGAMINKLTANPSFKRIDSQYESLFHMMVLEYTSIRKEIGEELKNDIEATQRKTLIDGVENFLKERDALLKGANLL